MGRWAFRTVFVDAADRRIWETVGGLEATLLRVPARARARLADWFRGGWEVLSPYAAQQDPFEVAALLEALRPATTLAMSREEAIRRALADRRARMAAMLVQPGLFDRTSERAATAQAAIADEALSRCDARLAALAMAHTVAVSSRELLFAVVLV